jgi:type VI secretion system protein ImpA
VLTEACGRDAPGLGGVGEALRDLSNLVSVALAEREAAPPRSPRRASGTPQVVLDHAMVDPASRDEAYAQLAEIADRLQALEPQSPAPYLIRRAIDWAGMSFAELVMSFSRAGLQLDQIVELLGLTPLAEPPDDGGHRKD